MDNEGRGLWAYDSTKGWFHGRSASSLPTPDDKAVHINSLGVRGPELTYAPPRGVRRVLVLGDSFAFGLRLGDDSTLAAQLGRRLGSGYEVVNLGVAGYSTDQELILFEELGRRLHPSLVLLLMCDNDFEGNTQDFSYRLYHKPYFEGLSAGLALRNVPVPRLTVFERMRYWLGRHSNTWKLLTAIANRRVSPRGPVALPWLAGVFDVARSRPSTPDIRLAGLLVERLKGAVEESGARLVVLNAGQRGERTRLFRGLRRRFRATGVEYIEVEGPLGVARRSNPSRAWDFGRDTHWDVDSVAFVANLAAERLAAGGSLEATESAPSGARAERRARRAGSR